MIGYERISKVHFQRHPCLFKDDLTLRERKKNLLELIRNSKIDTLKSLFPSETFLSVRKKDSTVQLHQYYFTMPSHRQSCKRCSMFISWWIWSSKSSKYRSSSIILSLYQIQNLYEWKNMASYLRFSSTWICINQRESHWNVLQAVFADGKYSTLLPETPGTPASWPEGCRVNL